MIFQSVSLILFLCYVILILAITVGWYRLKAFKSNHLLPEIKVSVVIAARNEAMNIEALLTSLCRQDYPRHLYEIILVDDHSTDETSQIAEAFISIQKDSTNLKLITLSGDEGFGKKAALTQGIQASDGEIIVITDADCTAGISWISTLAAYYKTYKPQMILGPVKMNHGSTLFGKLQTMEFMSLISSAAGSCKAGFPILANGANMAFTRLAYESCGGFSGNMQFPSGDDMFLMMNIKKKFGVGAIHFLKSAEAVVSTPAAQGLKPFIQQRLRWVSKSKGYTDPVLIVSSLIVFFTNGLLVFTGLMAIAAHGFLTLFLSLFFIKLAVDFPLMLSFSRFQRSGSLFWLFPLMEIVNAVYTLIIGMAGNIGKYEWKGRK